MNDVYAVAAAVNAVNMSHLLVVPPPPSENHRSPILDHQASHYQTFFTTMAFNSVIPLCDSA